MAKVLMIDLEGTLIATAIPKNRFTKERVFHPKTDYGIRPHAHEFVREVFPIFDSVYLNTTANEGLAVPIVEGIFGVKNVGYYHGNPSLPEHKTAGYEKFMGDTLVHVEDGLSSYELANLQKFGFAYLRLRSWTIADAFINVHNDDELLRVADEIMRLPGMNL